MSALPLNVRTRTSTGARPGQPRPGRTAAKSRPMSPIPPASIDPLAEVHPWGVFEPKSGAPGADEARQFPASASDLPLSDMVDRASAQLVILRRTLDEAASVNRASRQNGLDLTQRLEAGRRLQTDLDQRIAASGNASTILEKASTTLRGLEHLVSQLRAASGALEQKITARLNEQAAGFETKLSQLSARFEARIAEISARSDALATDTERKVQSNSDRLGAEIDRRTAQVQARVSLVLDSASDRVQTLESQAEHIGGVITQRVEALCTQAAEVLGRDPRTQGIAAPVAGSLEERLAATRSLIQDAKDASIRLASLVGETETASAKVRQAGADARAAIEGVASLREEAVAQVEHAMSRVRELEDTTAQAAERHGQAIESMSTARQELVTLREDLGTMAAAVGYHISQSRDAQQLLTQTCQQADARLHSLNDAIELVGRQAENLVALARDAAAIVTQANAAEAATTTPPDESIQNPDSSSH